MKVKYEAYKIGSKVWAISEYRGQNAKWHYAIFPAIVDSVTFDSDMSVEYWLTTPKGQDWGDSVTEDEVSDKFNVLVKKLQAIWIEHVED